MKKGKRYSEAAKLVDRTKYYDLDEAIKLVKETSTVKFDASVELAFRLNLDPRHAEQNLRGAIVLPHGTGRTATVVVVAEGDKAKEAEDAGADFVGSDEIIEKIQKGWFEFDVLVATPDMMAKLGRLGRVLGPKGLMPNPRTGTVTMDVGQAVEEIKAGKIEYRVDKSGNIHSTVGKVSFTDQQLTENIKAIYDRIMSLRPHTVRGTYLRNLTVTSSMGPGVKISREYMRELKG